MKIELREVEKKDWNFVLKLRNEFYEYSFYEQNEPILKDDHYKYMNKQETNPNFHQWVAFDGKNDVGYIRILDQDINIMVEKEFQSKGIGTIMLNLVEKKALSLGIKKLKAIVIAGNESSKKIFIKNNFKLILRSFEKEIS
jgi:RimJ/RimL family protein N-acetyltransferase|tara:strand:+ start:211 stop:633 length:423 start_codon:yes stop_codon:yes gene_type:complete